MYAPKVVFQFQTLRKLSHPIVENPRNKKSFYFSVFAIQAHLQIETKHMISLS